MGRGGTTTGARRGASVTLDYYYAPGTCSLAGMIALEAAGADYAPIRVDLAGDRAALRAVNPAAKVPALSIDGRTLTETPAILFWVGRRFTNADLLPTGEDALADALSIMAWLSSTVHIRRRQFARPAQFSPEPDVQLALRSAAKPFYQAEMKRLDALMGAREHAAATRSLAVRAYAFLFHQWATHDQLSCESLPNLTALAAEMIQLPAVVRAVQRHRPPPVG